MSIAPTGVFNQLNTLQNSTSAMQFQQSRQNLGSTKLDKDAFLRLLMAQLQNQDPLNPLEDSEFISQQAQFTQIEKLDQLNDTMRTGSLLSQSSSLVGKTIQFAQEGGGTFTGRVDSVQLGDGNVGLKVGNQTFSMGQVLAIFADAPPAP